MDAEPWLPTPEAVNAHLASILARGDVNLGARADHERLMLMLTRSCELRCGYCFVDKTERGLELHPTRARRGVDLLMASDRAMLEVQFFGGEPARRWDVLTDVLEYATEHPRRGGRRMRFTVTTNGVSLDAARIAHLERYPVTVLFSLDGDQRAHERFRQAHLMSDVKAWERISATVEALRSSTLMWFMNVTVAPAGADEVWDRYVWARAHGVPRLQLNYSVGHAWSPSQERRYLVGLQRVLHDHARHPEGLILYNWKSFCEPTILSDDLIVDTDGTVLHDAAIFLERSLPELKVAYRRGHLDDLDLFDPLRLSLAELDHVLRETYPPGTRERRIVEQNERMGAAVELVIAHVHGALGDRVPRQDTA
jgi:pyruvate-formate lyase-activating enzyme